MRLKILKFILKRRIQLLTVSVNFHVQGFYTWMVTRCMEYTNAAIFWNAVFAKKKAVNPEKSLPPGIEEGVKWLAESCSSIIDFGCGRGSACLRCNILGAEQTMGIDISLEAISLAKQAAAKYNVTGSAFICGGIPELSKFKENEFKGGILSNVIDNMHPEDASIVLQEYHRILYPSGHVFLKLNPYFSKNTLDTWNVEKIAENFYKEETGLYFLNIDDDAVTGIVENYFTIVKKEMVNIPEQTQVNRVYYLENKE